MKKKKPFVKRALRWMKDHFRHTAEYMGRDDVKIGIMEKAKHTMMGFKIKFKF